jgi:hypothetical protein
VSHAAARPPPGAGHLGRLHRHRRLRDPRHPVARWRNLPPLLIGLAAMGLVLMLVRKGRRTGAVALMLTR